MGNESSQIAGASQDVDGVVIKPDPEAKENENGDGVPNWEDSAGGESLMRNGGAKAAERRKKKKRKKQQSELFSEAADDMHSTSSKKALGKKAELQLQAKRSKQSENGDSIPAAPAIDSAHRKKADLKAKKQRLLAVAAAAAGDINTAPSGLDLDEDEHASAFQEEDISTEFIRGLAQNSSDIGLSEEPQPNPGTGKAKRLKAKSRPSDGATKGNKQRGRISAARQLSTPDANSQARDSQTTLNPQPRQVEDNRVTRQKRGSIISHTNSTSRRKKEEIQAKDMPYVDSSDELSPEVSRPHNQNRILPDMDGTAAYIEDPRFDSDASTPNSSPQPIARSRSNRKVAKESRVLPPKAQHDLHPREISVMSEPEEDMLLIDPALRTIGTDFDPKPRQIGIYINANTPQMARKRKRRLPVDNEYEIPPGFEESQKKKPRKSLVKPKNTGSSTTRNKNGRARESSADLDVPVSIPNKRQSNEKNGNARKLKTNENTIKGRFTAEEFALLDNEMMRHREMHGLSVFDQNQMVQEPNRDSVVTELWDNMCSALPDRSRRNVLKVLRRRYHNFARGTWSQEEDMELKEAYERRPNCWIDISRLLNRHPDDCRDRWRNYVVCGDKRKKTYWSDDEENRLRTAVAECIQAVRELKAAEVANNPAISRNEQPDIELIDWQVVSAKLDHTRSRLQCLSKWKLLEKLADSDDEDVPDLEIHKKSWRVTHSKKEIKNMRREDYLELLWAIRHSQAGREGKVPWRKLSDVDFQKKWSCMTRKVAWRKLREMVPGNRDMKLQDIVTILIDNLPLDVDFHSEREETGLSTRNSTSGRGIMTAPMAHMGQQGGRSHAIRNTLHRVHDPFTDELGEDEFDPDDVGEGMSSSAGNRNLNISQDMVREAVEAYGDENSWNAGGESGDEVEEIDYDVAMDDSHDEAAGSVDLDAPSQEFAATGSAARLRSPIAFKAAAKQRTSNYSGSLTHSDEDDADMDIPARRSPRQESVDLGMT